MSRKNTRHVYTTTEIERAATKFRLYNYFVLLSMVLIDKLFGFHFPELSYIVVLGAVVGVDFQKLFSLKKGK